MTIIRDALAAMAQFAIQTTSFLGYGGIVLLMTIDSTIFPLPSELVMPFAGFLAATGRFNIWLVILASGIGSLLGSLLSYWMGRYGGNAPVLRWGHWVFLDVEDLKKTEDWFARKGEAVIFVSRFIPVVRQFISIPAGIARMNIWRFSLYTFLGATLWNGFLAWLGFFLGERWEEVGHVVEQFSNAIAVLLVVAAIWFVWHHVGHKRRKKALEKQLAH